MEGKGCVVCCVLMILVICANNAQALQLPHEAVAPNPIAEHSAHDGKGKLAAMRARRGVLGSAAKGAALGAVAGGVIHAVKKG